jgi:glycosyltransferase involved in cell wall biosynthesis
VRRVRTWRRRADRSDATELLVYAIAMLLALLCERPDRDADLCHVHFLLPDGLVAWFMRRLTGMRFVVTAHGSDVPGYNPHRFRLAHRLLAPLWRRIVAATDRVVCASMVLRQSIVRASPQTAPVVIPNGLDADRFRPDRRKRLAVLSVTRLFERKGLHHLLDAAVGLQQPVPIHIVGTGPEMAALEAQAHRLGLPVTFHGWLDNENNALRDLLESTAIFVLPSSAENFPVSLLEAMAAGMAIVTTADTGCAEVVRDAALLVPSGDVPALRTALDRLIGDPELRDQLGARARQHFERTFTWTTVAAAHERLYLEVLAERAQRCRPEEGIVGDA